MPGGLKNATNKIARQIFRKTLFFLHLRAAFEYIVSILISLVCTFYYFLNIEYFFS